MTAYAYDLRHENADEELVSWAKGRRGVVSFGSPASEAFDIGEGLYFVDDYMVRGPYPDFEHAARALAEWINFEKKQEEVAGGEEKEEKQEVEATDDGRGDPTDDGRGDPTDDD